tara:strand:+ start:782 stop:979 length:198 start_codon:yes stop_codon:yes gene_type:complete
VQLVKVYYLVKQKGKKMALTRRGKAKIKKVIKGLNKASKTHAGQAKTLKGIVGNGKAKRPKSRNR